MARSYSSARSYDSRDSEEVEDNMTAIHRSIVRNDPASLQQVCTTNSDLVNTVFTEDVSAKHTGMTPLSLAASFNRVDIVKILLDANADVNATFANLVTTALMTSAFHGHADVVRMLIEKGASTRAVDLQGSTALGYCFGGKRSTEVAQMLINAGVDVNYKNMLGMNALHLVAGYENEKLLRCVLEAGADPNATNDFGHSSLHLVVLGKRARIAANITGRGTPFYGLNIRNLDQLLKDWSNSHRDLIRDGTVEEAKLEKIGNFMMNIGEKLEHQDDLKMDDQEAVKKRLEAVERCRQDLIVSMKANKRSGVVDTLLSCAGRRGKQAKAASGSMASNPYSAPIVSSGSQDEDAKVMELCETFARSIQLLIESGCRVDTTERTFGITALDMAILFGDMESAALLSAAGADSNHLMKLFAMSDLYYDIAIQPEKKYVKELLSNDRNLDVNDSFTNFNVTKKPPQDAMLEKNDGYPRGDAGLTPLAVAAKAPDSSTISIIKILLKRDAKLDKIGSGGRSPLGEAARYGNLKMVEFLVSRGAVIDQPNPAFKNATPVVIAVICKQIKIVEYLLSQSAKIDIPMSDGRTALDKAMEASDMPMIDVILGQSEFTRNCVAMHGFTYRMIEHYKVPNRNMQIILEEISRNVQEIAEKEQEDRRRDELQKGRDAANRTRTMTPMSSASTAHSGSSYKRHNGSNLNQQQGVVAKPRSGSRTSRSEVDSGDDRQSYASSRARTTSQLSEYTDEGRRDANSERRRQAGNQQKENAQLQARRQQSEESEADSQLQSYPKPPKHSKNAQMTLVQATPPNNSINAIRTTEIQVILAPSTPQSQSAIPQGRTLIQIQPTPRSPSLPPPPPPMTLPPESDEGSESETVTDSSEEESEEEEDVQPTKSSTTVSREVVVYPPEHVSSSSTVRVVRSEAGGSRTVTATRTTVTKTVVATAGVMQTVNRAQIVQAGELRAVDEARDDDDDEDDDEEEEEEESEEEESEEESEETADRGLRGPVQIQITAGHRAPIVTLSAETDI